MRSSRKRSLGNNDLVDTNVVVCETGEEEISTLVPCETSATNWLLLLFVSWIDWRCLEVNNEFLGWKIPNLNSSFSTQYEPILLGGEENAVNG